MKAFSKLLFLILIVYNSSYASQTKSEFEYKESIIKNHRSILLEFSRSPMIISSLIEANKNNPGIVKIMQLDANWQLNRELQTSVMINPITTKITAYIEKKSLNIAEMMVLDINGVVIAVFPKPTDYWQGDEDKFQQPIHLNGDYVGPTKWDTSSQTYSFFYSILIKDENQKIIGVLATGLDVTKEYLNNLQKN